MFILDVATYLYLSSIVKLDVATGSLSRDTSYHDVICISINNFEKMENKKYGYD